MPQPIVIQKRNPWESFFTGMGGGLNNLAQYYVQSKIRDKLEAESTPVEWEEEDVGSATVVIGKNKKGKIVAWQPYKKNVPEQVPRVYTDKNTGKKFYMDNGRMVFLPEGESDSAKVAKIAKGLREEASFETPEEKANREVETARRKAEVRAQVEQQYKSPKAITQPEPEKAESTLTELQKKNLMKDLASAEKAIMNNPESEAQMGNIRFFNEYANTPYMYVWKDKEVRAWRPDKKARVEKIKLPVKDGKQLTAEDIRFTAQKRNMTIEQVLLELGLI